MRPSRCENREGGEAKPMTQARRRPDVYRYRVAPLGSEAAKGVQTKRMGASMP
jgi:hypothetical protein